MSECSCSSCSHELSHKQPLTPSEETQLSIWARLWKTQKSEVTLIAASLLLFAVSFALDHIGSFLAPYSFGATLLVCGSPVFVEAFKSLTKGHGMDETFLMTIASIGAFTIAQYPEAVAVMLFYQIGEIFQGQAVGSSKDAINALIDMRPKKAHLIAGPQSDIEINVVLSNSTTTVDASTVQLGSFIRVKPGEQVPLDGVIAHGESTMNTAFLTGESLPRAVAIGSNVDAGFINGNAPVIVRTTSLFENSAVARILALLEDSSDKKATQDVLIKRFARLYTPLIVAAAVVVGIIIPTVLALPFVGIGSFTMASFSPWIYKALLFLVVSCPCALVISVPLTYFASIGAAAKVGVLVKGETYIEQLAQTTTCIFDKTGTLTLGQFVVKADRFFSSTYQPSEIYAIIAALESHSNHPLAKSVEAFAQQKCLDTRSQCEVKLSQIEEVPGRGIQAYKGQQNLRIGNSHFVTANEDPITARKISEVEDTSDGQLIFMSIDGVLVYVVELIDTIKPEAKCALCELKTQGISTVMLTGDEQTAANHVAAQLGIDIVKSQLLPQDKVSEVEMLAHGNENGTTIFCGDGINDAPSLARADVGIAMGGLGADAAIEAADAVFTHDNIEALPRLIKLSKKTVTIVKQNIGFALTVKIGILVLGLFGLANMWGAVFADVGVTILLIFNALRVLLTSKNA